MLTDQQKKALSRDRNLSVTAGAGTGKTLLLVERYLDILINEPLDVRNILAITFTKKAAAEMKERIVNTIDEKLMDDRSDKNRKKLIKARDHMSASAISTIHAFCARLLREYPVEAGIDPDFRQLNDIQRQLLLDEEIDKQFDQLDRQPDQWISLFRMFGKETIKSMLAICLDRGFEMKQVLKEYTEKNTDQIFQSWCELFLTHVKKGISEQKITIIRQHVKNILGNLPNGNQNDPKIELTIEKLNKYERANNGDDLQAWRYLFELADHFTTGKNLAYTKAGSFGSSRMWGVNNSKELLALSGELESVMLHRISVPGNKDKEIIAQLKKFYVLCQAISERFMQRKNDLGVVDYEDLQLYALQLLQDYPEVRRKISSTFQYIMVDEFQDTNFIQWQIIRSLGELKDHKYFIVGDPKQSIYGFRNADIRVFQHVKDEFIKSASQNSTDPSIVLRESFRFAPKLAGFINKTFEYILQPSADNAWEVTYDVMTAGRDSDSDGSISLAILDEPEQANYIIQQVRQLSDRYQYGQMAVMLRTRSRLVELEETLRRNNIPFHTIGGIGFYQRQEIYDIYHLVRFLLNPDDDNALIGILRSPLANVSDEGIFFLGIERNDLSYWQYICALDSSGDIPESDYFRLMRFKNMAGQWIETRDRLAFHELLHLIFEESGYRAILNALLQGDRFIANLDKMEQMATEFESTGFLSLYDFAESLHYLIFRQDKEGEAQTDFDDENSLKIMTIHQAKGLEYDVVFVPYLEQELRKQTTNRSFFGDQLGVAAALYNAGSGDDNGNYYLLDFLINEKRAREIAELKRLFYVACTRARETLVLSMNIKNDKVSDDTAASWLLKSHDIDVKQVKDGDHFGDMVVTRNFVPDEDAYVSGRIEFDKNLDAVFGANVDAATQPVFEKIPDSPQGEIFSATQIMKHETDANEYKMRYHYGFFPDDYELPARFDQAEANSLLLGKVAHRYFEEYPDFKINRLYNDLEIFDTDLREQIDTEINRLGELALSSTILASILHAGNYRNEISVMMKIGDDFLGGTLDKVYLNSDDLWEVIDYKTNRITQQEMARTFKNYQIQIEVYALLLSHIFPGQENYPVSLYFTHIDKVKTRRFSSEELEDVKEKMLEKIAQMKVYDPYV
jgi:ATP-dependent helicase/nuclease subunit A